MKKTTTSHYQETHKIHVIHRFILMMGLFILPVIYSFHFVAAKTEITTIEQSEQDDGITSAIQLFEFNPNTASENDLKRLGLPGKVIEKIMAFRAKGGTFRKAEDLNKIYGFTDLTFKNLKPYIKVTKNQ